MVRTFAMKISSQGQVTVPAAVREHLGVSPGDQLLFIAADDGEVTLATRRHYSAAELSGILPPLASLSVDLDSEIDAAMAEELDRIAERSDPS